MNELASDEMQDVELIMNNYEESPSPVFNRGTLLLESHLIHRKLSRIAKRYETTDPHWLEIPDMIANKMLAWHRNALINISGVEDFISNYDNLVLNIITEPNVAELAHTWFRINGYEIDYTTGLITYNIQHQASDL
jgi:hypothetical protein